MKIDLFAGSIQRKNKHYRILRIVQKGYSFAIV